MVTETAGMEKTYVAPSLTASDKQYEIRGTFGSFACTCPHYQYRLAGTGKICKHIQALEDALLAEAVDMASEIPF